jgi:hypothetical protein
MLPLGGCMWSMQCNVECGYQLSICSGTKENHRNPWSSWPVAGPSGCKLAWSQQSGIKYASPNISPYPSGFFPFLPFFFYFFLWKHLQFVSTNILSEYNLDKWKDWMYMCTNMLIKIYLFIYIYIYLYLLFFDYRQIWEFIVVCKKSVAIRGSLLIQQQILCFTVQFFRSFFPSHLQT